MTAAAIVAATALELFFAEPAPLEMPSAEAYLVRMNGVSRLEDRYDALDLWTSQSVIGRWIDDEGRVFTLASLDYAPPSSAATRRTTREGYAATRKRIGPKDLDARDAAVALLSPFDMPDEPSASHVGLNGWKILYYHGTNTTAVSCAFLPKGRDTWHFASWELAEGDDFAVALERFESDFLADWDAAVERHIPTERGAAQAEKARRRGDADPPLPGERELLRADARHSVANYPRWNVTDGREFSVLDDLRDTSGFVVAFTNDLSAVRARYASVLPSPIDGTNTLCVARIFRDRAEYAAALGVNGRDDMEWSAAYWNPSRREIVAYLPPEGERELLRTLRHEAFHQYLSYACSMIAASPWLNEGYAQYFEDEESADWGLGAWRPDPKALAPLLPLVFAMDYRAFYSGTDEERALKYRLAWSVAVFIEKGADKVRGRPFANLKRDYVAALIRTQDMLKATAAAFGSERAMDDFVDEWVRFWTEGR
ncbi:MAG: hypothetical protein J6U17_04630 [Kiritimatiellae bacterium]|nr:hypothetical protein [Kiritimatiellia bacterium]